MPILKMIQMPERLINLHRFIVLTWITKMKEALERSRLLTEKVNELTSIFSDESIPLDSLRNLRILCNRESPHALSGIISQATAPSPSAGEETSVDGNVTEQAPEGTVQTASRRKKN